MRTSEQFRNMIKASGVIQIPGCYDCITATIVERAGFPAAYLTGSGIRSEEHTSELQSP